MALTAAEQAELDQLNSAAPQGMTNKLTPAEQEELAQLQAMGSPIKPKAPQDEIVNEMPEGFSGRFMYKNLGNESDAGFNYLQKENPDFEIKKDPNGEVIARKRGTQAWGRMDPQGFDWRDLTDVTADVGTGALQGVATAASGLAGAGAGGIGAIPAAMAGSAASGAALEAARQGIGKYFGINDEIKGGDVGLAAGMGLASPLLFGTGATLAKAGEKAAQLALKTGAKTTAQDVLATQRGLVGRGYDATAGYFGPKIAALAGGENPTIIKKAAGMLNALKEADVNPDVVTTPLEQVAKQAPERIKEETRKLGTRLEEIRNTIDNQPGLVPVNAEGVAKQVGSIDAKPFVKPFQDLVAKLEKNSSGSVEEVADLAALKEMIQREFTGSTEFMTAGQLDAKRARFKELASDFGKKYEKSGSTVGSQRGTGANDKSIAQAFDEARRAMNDALIDKLQQLDPKLKKEYLDTNEAYSALKKLATKHEGTFKDAESVQNFLKKAVNRDVSASEMKKLKQVTGIDFTDLAERDAALTTFSRPSDEIRSLGRSTTIRQLALGAGLGYAGYAAAQASGGEYSPYFTAVLAGALGSKAASPAMLRKYMQMNSVMRELPANVPFRGYQAAPYSIMNMNKNDQK